ncbi:unnamed protein product [Cuscuta campestris]|uniref:Uncharacterized protein n=1 Tax=Cuscuta campestris TaxID=132261 RepID=A0A484NJP7_9ASTE|nr:unnamed protein product [Cuscuta campestris]
MNPEYNDPTPVMDPQYIDVLELDKLVNRVYGTGSNSEATRQAAAYQTACQASANGESWFRRRTHAQAGKIGSGGLAGARLRDRLSLILETSVIQKLPLLAVAGRQASARL